MYDLNDAPSQDAAAGTAEPWHPTDIERQFAEAMAARGLVPPKRGIVADGKMHRCDTQNRNGEGDGTYCLYTDGIPAGWFENHQDGKGVDKWHAQRTSMTESEQKQLRAVQRKQAKERKEQQERETAEARAQARSIWDACPPAPDSHPYLVKKGVPAYGLKLSGNHLVIAVYQHEGISSLQYIAEDGRKRFLPGGKVQGGVFPVGDPAGATILLIAEGYATAATLHRATGYPCLVAWQANNLVQVARAAKAAFPGAAICICADDDWKTVVDGRPTNVGQIAAIAATRAVGGKVAIPVFPDERQDKWTDFNDLALAAGEDGLAEVRRQVEAALGNGVSAPATGPSNSGDSLWMVRLVLANDGTPRDGLTNVALALRGDSAFVGRLRFDEHRGMAACRDLPWDTGGTWREWSENDDLKMVEWLNLRPKPIPVKKSSVADGVATVAYENRYHPVREWLESLAWDGVPRLHMWMIDFLGAKETLYTRAVSAAWIISGVARVMQPGCKADHALIMEGYQGIGKSTALKTLMPDESFFSDELSNLGSKDSAQDLRGKWLIEISELSAMKKSDNERTKAFLSRSTDHYRPSYGMRSRDFPRQCFFAGTTNADTYLGDETGARRFWPVRIRALKLDELKSSRDQLWAEAVHLYRQGAEWWLPRKLEEEARAEQARRFIPDPWEDDVLGWAEELVKTQPGLDRYLEEANSASDADTEYGLQRIRRCEQARMEAGVTVVGMLVKLGFSRDKRDQTASNRVARILRAAGWQRQQKRYGDKRQWEYWKPASVTIVTS